MKDGFLWYQNRLGVSRSHSVRDKQLLRQQWPIMAYVWWKTNNNILLFYPFVQDANVDSFVPCFAFVLCIMTSAVLFYIDHKPPLFYHKSLLRAVWLHSFFFQIIWAICTDGKTQRSTCMHNLCQLFEASTNYHSSVISSISNQKNCQFDS